jgi:GNAT superfamily N-acetyltransferase
VTAIRRATPADRPAIVRMALRFIAESSYRGVVCPSLEQLERLVDHLLEHPDAALFVAELAQGLEPVGMLAGKVVDNELTGIRTGSEICWYVDPEFRGGDLGIDLLEHAEAWAYALGAVRFEMISPAGSRLGRLYVRRGYRELETTWQRELAA